MEKERESTCFTKEQETKIKELVKQVITEWLTNEPSSSSYHYCPTTRDKDEAERSLAL